MRFTPVALPGGRSSFPGSFSVLEARFAREEVRRYHSLQPAPTSAGTGSGSSVVAAGDQASCIYLAAKPSSAVADATT